MAKILDTLTPELQKFIADQKIFFVGTAAEKGRVNISPKGSDSFRIIDNRKILWLNLTGSGNETAAHVFRNRRMTIMFCAFEGNPLILRLYGKAKIYHKRDKEFHNYASLFMHYTGTRQIIEMDIEMVQTSCGFGVPLMEFKEDRTILNSWANQKGIDKIEEYWKEKNRLSIDGFETKIIEE